MAGAGPGGMCGPSVRGWPAPRGAVRRTPACPPSPRTGNDFSKREGERGGSFFFLPVLTAGWAGQAGEGAGSTCARGRWLLCLM